MELGLGQDAAAGTMVGAVMTDGVRDGQSGQVRDFARGLRLVSNCYNILNSFKVLKFS